jgi:hypothetical protein
MTPQPVLFAGANNDYETHRRCAIRTGDIEQNSSLVSAERNLQPMMHSGTEFPETRIWKNPATS